MNQLLFAFFTLIIFVFTSSNCDAAGGRGGGSVSVRGYTRKDGTYVAPYTRSAPGTKSSGSYSGSDSYSSPTTSSKPSNESSTSATTTTQPVAPAAIDPAVEAAKKAETAVKVLEFHKTRAVAGDDWAQYELGLRHLKGDGVPKDEDVGRQWLVRAAKQGHTQAIEKLHNTDYLETKRDENGRIIRSSTARHEFMVQTGYPHGRPGYVIDHIVPLKKAGCDCPENMQWQTIEDAKAKDNWE